MLGMSFPSFLVLLVSGTVAGLTYHYVLRYRFLGGLDSLFGKIAMGWLGGWLGSPAFGHWSWKIGRLSSRINRRTQGRADNSKSLPPAPNRGLGARGGAKSRAYGRRV